MELDAATAYRPLVGVRWGFGVLVVLLASASAYGFLTESRREVLTAERLGGYRLEGLIGEGGIAKVYRARHVALQRTVAIKLLKGASTGPDHLARFEREVRLASQLTDEHTIRVFDYGRSQDGTLFYVMELVDGQTLLELVRADGPMEPSRRRALATAVV